MKKGFTLAEVLITLAIIGVVSAMTIPTLVNNYQKKQTVTKLQKAYSTLANALALSRAENGDYSTWHWNEITNRKDRTQYFWEHYLIPYMKVAKTCFPYSGECFASKFYWLSGGQYNTSEEKNGAILLNDGTTIFSWASGDGFKPHVQIFVDINGFAKPNTVGKDIFCLIFYPDAPKISSGLIDDEESVKSYKQPYGLSFYGEGLNPEDYENTNSRLYEEANSPVPLSCTKNQGGYGCGAYIKASGWKISDKYPW